MNPVPPRMSSLPPVPEAWGVAAGPAHAPTGTPSPRPAPAAAVIFRKSRRFESVDIVNSYS